MKKLILIFVCVVSLSSVFADEKSDVQVVVTADRIEHPVTDVPADIIVITREELKDKTIVEALETYAGISFQSYNGNRTQASVSMRGFGENSHGRVLVLVDGIKQNNVDMSGTDWIALPASAIERIEVLQGGASAIYGNGAVAGVINIITRKAGADKGFAADAQAQLSSFDGNAAKFYMSGAGKYLSLSLSGNMEHNDGWRDRTMYDLKQISAKLDCDIKDIFSAGLNFTVFTSDYEMAGAIIEEIYDDDPKRAAYYDDDANLEGCSISFISRYNPVDILSVVFSAGYRHKENKTNMDSWTTWTTTKTNSFFVSPAATLNLDFDWASDSFTLGLDFAHDRITSKGYSDSLRNDKTCDNDVAKRNVGVFANNDIRFLNDALAFTLGARYDYECIDAFDDDVKFYPFSLTAGINYLFPDTSNVYFRYDRVFRTPFTDEQVSYQGYGEGFNSDLDPEYGNSFEMGFNLNSIAWFSIGASGYVLMMKDEIAYNNNTLENENMNDTIHYGINAKANFKFKYFSLLAIYGWTEAKFTEGDYNDNDIPLVPHHRFTAVPTVYLPYGFSLSADVSYTGSVYVGQDYDNALDRNKGYFLTGVVLEYKYAGKLFTASAFGRINNLFDIKYASCAYIGYDASFNAVPTFYPGNGREFIIGGTLSY